MYKNPELSATAKTLKKELAKFGADITHAQALEIVARVEGARTLHVAQSKSKQPIELLAAAKAQAASVLFETLGRYAENVDGLLSEITSAFERAGRIGPRGVEARMREIFETENSPKVSILFNTHRTEQLPHVYSQLVTQLAKSLAASAKVEELHFRQQSELHRGRVVDWAITGDPEEDADLQPHQFEEFEVRIQRDFQQFYFDVAPPHADTAELEGKPQMTLFVEINDGLPCVHMSNALYGDQVLTVFFTTDGLYLRPDSNCLEISHKAPDGELASLDQRQAIDGPVSPNRRFISTKSHN